MARLEWSLTLCCSIAESVRGDIEWVRANPLIRDHLKNGCKGFVLDIKTGEAEPIKA